MFEYYLGQWEARSQKHWARRSNRTIWSSVLSPTHTHTHTDTASGCPLPCQATIAVMKAWKSFTEVYFKSSAVCVMVQEQEQTLQVGVKAVGA